MCISSIRVKFHVIVESPESLSLSLFLCVCACAQREHVDVLGADVCGSEGDREREHSRLCVCCHGDVHKVHYPTQQLQESLESSKNHLHCKH